MGLAPGQTEGQGPELHLLLRCSILSLYVYMYMYDCLKIESQLFYIFQLSLKSYRTLHQRFPLQHEVSFSLMIILLYKIPLLTLLYVYTWLKHVSQHIYPSFLEAFRRLILALWLVASYKMLPHWRVCSVPDTDSLSNEGEIKRNTYSEQTDTNAANSYWW